MKSKRGKILSIVLVIIMVLSMLPISAIAKDVEKDDIQGWGYWSENSYLMHMKQASPVEYDLRFPGLDSTNYWLQLDGDDKSYIAFCFNEKKSAPKKSRYQKKYENADINEFYDLAEAPMKNMNFRNAVIWATHLGFPENQGSFNGQSILDRAVDFYHIPEDCAVDAVHLATQMAIWLFTDYDTALKTFFSPINADNSLGNGDPSRVKIWDHYDKATMGDPITYLAADIAAASRDKHLETPKDVELDLYKPKQTRMQNLLVTHHTEMHIETKPAKVTLNIQKKMSDGRPVKDQEFSFKFTGNNGEQDFDLTVKNDAQGKVNIPEIEFKKPGKYQFFIEEIPGSDPMIEYQKGKFPITVNVEGVRELKAEVSYGDKNNSQLVITNQAIAPKLGQLQIIKDVAGEGADPDKQFDFTVTLTGPDGKLLDGEFGGYKFKNGTTNVKVSKNVPVTIKEIPAGTTYVVSEAPLTQDDEYTLTSKNDLTGKIDANNTAKVTFLNTAKPKPLYGDLMISKSVKSAPEDHSKDRFDFIVKLDDPKADTTNVTGAVFTDGIAKLSLAAGESVVIKGLPAGTGYTVVEETPDGYAVVSTGSAGRIAADQQHHAAFENTYLKTGELTIQKVIDGAAASDHDTFTFRVMLTQGDQPIPDGTCKVQNQNGDVQTAQITNGILEVSITGSGFVTISDLPTDVHYYVEERTEDGTFTATESNPVENGYILTDVTGNGMTTASDKQMKVVFTNTRDTAKGTLQIFKRIEGSLSSTEDEFRFRITLKDANGAPLSGNFYNQDGDKISFDANGSAIVMTAGGNAAMPRFVKIIGIPVGTAYTVEEFTGTTNEYTAAVGTLVENGYILKEVAGDPHGSIVERHNEVTFVNRKADTSLTIQKTIDGGVWTDDTFTFDIQLAGAGAAFTGERDGVSFENGRAAVTIRGIGSVTIKGLPECTYSVTERPIDGWIVPGGHTGDLSDGNAATAVFQNIKAVDTPVSVSFQARKTMDGKVPQENQFTFILSDHDGSIVDVQSNNAEGLISFKPQSFDSVGDYTYTIQEETGISPSISYDTTVYTAKVHVTKNEPSGELQAEVTYLKNGTETVAEPIFENTTIAPAGISVSVKKVWKLDDGGIPTDSVTVVLLRDGEPFATAELNEEKQWTFTWDDLDENARWSVDEKDVPAGFTHTVTGENGAFTITNDDVPTVPETQEKPTSPSGSETTVAPSVPQHNGNTPQTGDNSHIFAWFALAAASVTGAVMLLMSKKKDQQNR